MTAMAPPPPTERPPDLALPRARGELRASFVLRDGRTRLARLYQQGSARAILPATPGCEMVVLNTSGGLAGGDRLRIGVDLAEGTHLTATTQTAERAYRATTSPARIEARLTVGAGAHLDWLPQETILFDGARLHRDQEVALAHGASCLWAETLILGRAAMGETVRRLDLTDRRRITRDGRPLHVENLRLDDAALADGASPATLAGSRAFATVVLVAEGAERLLAPARAALGRDGAASLVAGRLVARLIAADGWPLRQTLARLIAALRPGPLPRVWQI